MTGVIREVEIMSERALMQTDSIKACFNEGRFDFDAQSTPAKTPTASLLASCVPPCAESIALRLASEPDCSDGDDEREQDCRRHNIPLACGAQIISAPGEVSRKGYERHANPGHSHRKKRNDQNDPLAKSSDLEMLFMPGGRERTCPEWDTLFAKAGFEITRIFPMKTAKA